MTRSSGIFIIAFFYLLTSFFFTYVNFDPKQLSLISRVCVMIFVCYLLVNWNIIDSKKNDYESYPFVLYFLLAPIVTHISCYLSNGQSILSSISVSASAAILSVYFFCILKGVDNNKIIQLILFFAILRTVITLIEQFTYPNILFSFNLDSYDDFGRFKEIEVRSGMRRFDVADAYYLPVFMGFYSLAKLIKDKKSIYAVLFIIACLGLYMDQTRQILFVFFLCILLTPFFIEKKSSGLFLKASVVVLLLLAILYFNYDALFGELAEKTSDQLNDDYTRSVEIVFFLSRLGGLLTILFGNGWFGNSAYGKEYMDLQDSIKMYRCDVGIIGAMHMLGVIFVLIFVLYLIRMLWRNRRYLSMEYKLFFLFVLFDIPLIFPVYNFTFNSAECFMGLLFYMADKNIQQNRAEQIRFKNIQSKSI